MTRIAFFALILAPAAFGRTETRVIRWSDLPALARQETVTVVLRGGNRIQGRIAGLQPESLLVDVLKSSDRRAYPPGQHSVPRKDVAEVRLRKIRGPFRAILAPGAGTGVFFATLPWAISESRFNVSDPKRITQHAFITAGATVGGYFAGRALDTRVTILRFAPDQD